MPNKEITRDIVIAALNSGFPKTVDTTKDSYENNYIKMLKRLIDEVNESVSRCDQ